MAASRRSRPPFVLLWMWMWMWSVTCDVQYQAEEEEIFNSDKETRLGWKSDPLREWSEVRLRVGTGSPVPVLQACGKRVTRTLWSRWMERKDGHNLLMDIAFALEQEPSSGLHPLRVSLLDSDAPLARFQGGRAVLDLRSPVPFPAEVPPGRMAAHLNRSVALSLGAAVHRGFHLGLSFSGTCALVTSVRVYYRRCPDVTARLASFAGTGAGSGPQMGSCVKGAVEVSPPFRECNADGVWSPLQGGCTCGPGHQVMNDTCTACRVGYYKPVGGSGGCRVCPPNSATLGEGSEGCGCLRGFHRLPSDPEDLGCTKPPSAPVNLTADHHNASVLIVTWGPPRDSGGRPNVTYSVKCEEKEAEAGRQWGACGDGVAVHPDSAGLESTSATVTGLNPQRDYRLSVQAWNDMSTLQGAPPSSTATVTIHRWTVLPPVITVNPGLNIATHVTTPAPQRQRHFPIWLTVAILIGSLLLVAVISIVLCVLRHNYTQIRSDQEEELFPMSAECSYRRPQEFEAAPREANTVDGVVQLLEGFSSKLLASLKEVLVERHQLTLGKELGRGEFGSVYEGVFSPAEGVDLKVAVKTMRVGIFSREDLHDFLKEAEITRNFDHENVIRLLGVTLQREQDSPLPVPLVILPYMKHGDLRRFLIATRYGDIPMFVPLQSLLRFMIDIAAGMDYLSSQGFLHRDLAARNCMLGDDLRVCVADFGLSKKIYSSNYYRQNETIRVPIKWMAMESLFESLYTTKSDVWSFGVTMWEIASRGRSPYPGIRNHELLDLLSSGQRLKQPEDCDYKLYEVMQRCWHKEPARRPAFGELVETLRGLLLELPVLEASEEASYINRGLEVAAAAAASQGPQADARAGWENVYLPSPVGAAGAKDYDEDLEDGYLKCLTNPAVKGDGR